MKILFTIFLLIITANVTAQLAYYKSIEKSKDTLDDLRYFKNLDRLTTEKLDSFLVFIKRNKEYKKMFKEDKGFIQFSFHRNSAGRIFADLSVNSQYVDYKIFASKKNNFGNVFAFSFYKSALIFFTLPYSQHRIKEEFALILHDLMYPEFVPKVKQEIDIKTEDFHIQSPGIVKRYYFD